MSLLGINEIGQFAEWDTNHRSWIDRTKTPDINFT